MPKARIAAGVKEPRTGKLTRHSSEYNSRTRVNNNTLELQIREKEEKLDQARKAGQALAEQNRVLQSEIALQAEDVEDLQQEVVEIQRANKQVHYELQQLKHTLSDKEFVLVAQQTALKRLLVEGADPAHLIAELGEERVHSLGLLDNLPTPFPRVEEHDEFDFEVAEKERQEYVARVEEFEQTKVKCAEYHDEMNIMLNDIDDLTEQLQGTRNDLQISTDERTILNLTHEIEIAETKAEITGLYEKLRYAKTENQRLVESVLLHQNDAEAVREKRDILKRQYDEQQFKLSGTIESLQNTIDHLKGKVERLEREKNELRSAGCEEFTRMEEDLHYELATKDDAIRELSGERDQVQHQASRLKSELVEEMLLTDGLCNELDLTSGHINTLKDYSTNVVDRLKDADLALRQKEVALLCVQEKNDEMVATLNENLEYCQATILQIKTKESEWMNMVGKAKEDMVSMENEIQELRQYKEEALSLRKELSHKSKLLKDTEFDNEAQKQNELKRQIKTLDEEHRKYNKLLKEFEHSQEEWKVRVLTKEKQKTEMAKKADKYLHELDNAKLQILSLQAESEGTKAKLDSLVAEQDKLSINRLKDIDEHSALLTEQQDDIRQYKNEATQLRENNRQQLLAMQEMKHHFEAEMSDANLQFKLELGEKEEELCGLQICLEQERVVVGNLKLEHNVFQQDVTELKQQLGKVKTSLSHKTSELQGVTQRVTEKDQLLKALEKDLSKWEEVVALEKEERMRVEEEYKQQKLYIECEYGNKAKEAAATRAKQISTLKEELQATKHKNNEVVAQMQKANREKECELQKLQDALVEVRDEIQYKQQTAEQMVHYEKTEKVRLTEKLAEEKENTAQLKSDLQRIQRQCFDNVAKAQQENTDLRLQLLTAQQSEAAKMDNYAHASNVSDFNSKIKSLKREVESVKQENELLQTEKKNMQERHREEQTKQQTKLLQQIADMDKLKDSAKTESQMRKQIKELEGLLRSENTLNQDELMAKMATIGSLEEKLAVVEVQLQQLREENKTLNRQLAQATDSNRQQEIVDLKTSRNQVELQFQCDRERESVVAKLQVDIAQINLQYRNEVDDLRLSLERERSTAAVNKQGYQEAEKRWQTKLQDWTGSTEIHRHTETELAKVKVQVDHYKHRVDALNDENQKLQKELHLQLVEQQEQHASALQRERDLRHSLANSNKDTDVNKQLQAQLTFEQSRCSSLEKEIQQVHQAYRKRMKTLNEQRDVDFLEYKQHNATHQREINRLESWLEAAKLQAAATQQSHDDRLKKLESRLVRINATIRQKETNNCKDMIAQVQTNVDRLKAEKDREHQECIMAKTLHRDEIKRLQRTLVSAIEEKEQDKQTKYKNLIDLLNRQRKETAEIMTLKAELQEQRNGVKGNERQFAEKEAAVYQQLHTILSAPTSYVDPSVKQEYERISKQLEVLQQEMQQERTTCELNATQYTKQQTTLFDQLLKVLQLDTYQNVEMEGYLQEMQALVSKVDGLQQQLQHSKQKLVQSEQNNMEAEQTLLQNILELKPPRVSQLDQVHTDQLRHYRENGGETETVGGIHDRVCDESQLIVLQEDIRETRYNHIQFLRDYIIFENTRFHNFLALLNPYNYITGTLIVPTLPPPPPLPLFPRVLRYVPPRPTITKTRLLPVDHSDPLGSSRSPSPPSTAVRIQRPNQDTNVMLQQLNELTKRLEAAKNPVYDATAYRVVPPGFSGSKIRLLSH